MKAKADALKNSKLGMGVGFGTGVDFNKRLRGRAGRAKAVVAADNQLEEMQKTRRQLRRARKKWGKSIFEAEQSRRLGEQESDTLLYNISRIGRLRAYQEEQLLKLAELTAVHDPDLLLAAIEAVEEKDAEACMNAVGTGVGMAERERMGKSLARQQAAQKEKEREQLAEKWRQHIMAAHAGVSYEELMYTAEKKEQQTKELLSSIKQQVGAKMRHNKEATGTLEGTFRAIDVDGGGSIDYVEFGEFLAQLGATVTGEELELLTQMLDKDSDGTIDYDEFVAWFRGGENGETYAEQVADIFREYAPQRLGEVGSLLARYEYNEETLLAALRKQYKVAEAERAKRDAARVQGNSDEIPPRSIASSSSSLLSTTPGKGRSAARSHPRTALEPLEAAPSTPAALALDMADSYGGQLVEYQRQQEGEWQQSSLGVSLIAKMTSPTRLGVAAAAALVAQEAEEEIQSRFDLTVWQTEEGVVVSDAGLQEIKDVLDQGQAAARAAAARKRALAEATSEYILDVIQDKVQGELAYKEERRIWEEKQARLAAEAAFNAKMAALQRQKELFCPSPRTARQRKFAERYRHLRREGAPAYDDGAFAIGLVGAKSKGDAIARDHAKSAAIRHMLNRPLVRVFNAWHDWARTNVGTRSWGALQTATKWKFDKVGTMLDGTMDLVEVERARQALVQKADADRKERRSLRGVSKRAEAAYEKQMAKVRKLDTILRQKVPWAEQEPPEFGRRRHIRKY
jgi:Ca2+-binding EF-hand superfamily protein